MKVKTNVRAGKQNQGGGGGGGGHSGADNPPGSEDPVVPVPVIPPVSRCVGV